MYNVVNKKRQKETAKQTQKKQNHLEKWSNSVLNFFRLSWVETHEEEESDESVEMEETDEGDKN